MGSSAFLTPPLSDDSKDKQVYSRDFYQKPPPKFNLDEVEERNDKNIQESSIKVDFLNEFYSKSMINTVCRKIFDYLDTQTLLRASHVSSTWQRVVRYDIRSSYRISLYLKKMRKQHSQNKENISVGVYIPATPSKVLCKPLLCVNTNIDSPIPTKLLAVENILTPLSTERYRKCPECQTPAKVSQPTRTCHCDRCDTDFCIHCFYSKNKHSPTCQTLGGTGTSCMSLRKLTNKNNRRFSMGGKENRARLKRL